MIKRINADGKQLAEQLFQFHIGMIKRAKIVEDGIDGTKFQFHIGMIKR